MITESKTMAEAKDLLRVSQPTLYGLINSGKLKTYKVGRRRFTTNQSIEKCIKSLEAEAAV